MLIILKCGECGVILSVNNESGLCDDCQSRIEAETSAETNQELYEDEQKRIDTIMAQKYPKCPDCGSSVYLMPPEIPQIDESKWVHCNKCCWSTKFEEDTGFDIEGNITEEGKQKLEKALKTIPYIKSLK